MSQIRLNYDEMSAVAVDISGCAEEARTAIHAIERAVGELTPLWQGKARAAFDPAYAACLRDMSHVPLMLDQISTALHGTARTIRLAEQRARDAIETVVVDDTAGGAA
jgi:WXG100 family type VII secretion target